MKFKNIFTLLAILLPAVLSSQTITFEEQDYKALGVYDTWEASPFRTGVLTGNYAVIDNHLTDVNEMLGVAPNPSGKILAVQRSRFGSNTFGVRVDLNETFELTTTTKYLHVFINRPYSGRVMVVGLGKRRDRPGQSPETEQFWAMTRTDVSANLWHDVVLPIKGNGGIDIYSLVIVPDCESPHNYTEDAICYIDNIEVNNNPASAYVYGYYPLSFGEDQLYTRNDRRLEGVKFTSQDGEQSVAAPASPNRMYSDMTEEQFTAKPGETVNTMFQYKGNWMNGYVYLDKDNDGKFSYEINEDYTLPDSSDLVAYSNYNSKNSLGASLPSANVLNPPAFTIPAGLEYGFYRLRFKVDWDCIDPAGSIDTSNPIIGNGGGVIDIRLNVHGDNCNVNDANRNGEVLSAVDNERLVTYKAPFGEDFRIRMNPENGFEYKGVIVKYGYNLQGDSIVNGNLQWQKIFFERRQFDENHEITIPAKYMCGDIEIEGLFIQEGTYVEPEKPTRYITTTIENGEFADSTTWYTIQIGREGYVLHDNGTADHIALNNSEVDSEDDSQLWCFVGNDEEGYRLYNLQAGAGKVLAAPTAMLGTTGANSFPTLQPVNALPDGYIDVWNFLDSNDFNSSDVAYAYMYEMGYISNKVNNRNNKLAFWNAGADAGSTLQVRFARVTTNATTGIECIEDIMLPFENGVIYDLSGRKVANPEKGIYIIGRKKVIVK